MTKELSPEYLYIAELPDEENWPDNEIQIINDRSKFINLELNDNLSYLL